MFFSRFFFFFFAVVVVVSLLLSLSLLYFSQQLERKKREREHVLWPGGVDKKMDDDKTLPPFSLGKKKSRQVL